MADAIINSYLHSIYYNSKHPGSFGGVERLHRAVKEEGKELFWPPRASGGKLIKISKGKIKKWLATQELYTEHKPVRRNFERPKVVVPTKYYQFDGDTVNMTRYVKYNGGYKYILVLIDILSRFVWAVPLKTLLAKEMKKALKKVLTTNPQHLRTDSGTEFVNSIVGKYLKTQKINHFRTYGEKKANYIERFIKTLKSKLTRAMNYANNYKWIEHLPKAVHSYNEGYHRSIKMSPSKAMDTPNPTLWNIQHAIKPKAIKKETKTLKQTKRVLKFKMNDQVKLSFMRNKFERAYDQLWTDELFYITSREVKQTIAQYTVKDLVNDPIKGIFFEPELQKVNIKNANTKEYLIEKVLKTRMRYGIKENLVRWLGWHKKFDSWIAVTEVKNLVKAK